MKRPLPREVDWTATPSEKTAARTRRYVHLRTQEGLVRISVWVPGGSEDLLRDYAQRLRSVSEAKLPGEREGHLVPSGNTA